MNVDPNQATQIVEKTYFENEQKASLTSLELSRSPSKWAQKIAERPHLISLELSCFDDKTKHWTGPVAKCTNLTSLTSLTFSCCHQITDPELDRIIRKCTNLTSLKLIGCYRATDKVIAAVKTCQNLTEIDLDSCEEITDEGLRQLLDVNLCRNLTFLGLSGCKKITKKGLSAINTCINLTSLDLYHCDGVTKLSLGTHTFKHLTSLNLGLNWSIQDQGLVSILTAAPNLSKLQIHQCNKITDLSLPTIGNLTNLTTLDMTHCKKITDIGINHLTSLHALTELNLMDTGLTNDGLFPLTNLTNLTSIGVGYSITECPIDFENIIAYTGTCVIS